MYRDVVTEVVDTIADSPEKSELGPYAQLSVATLCSYMGADAIAQDALDRGMRGLLERSVTHRLVGGLAGISWLLAHILGDGASDVCDAIDRRLLQLVPADRWDHEYELLRGVAGVGVYAIARQDTEPGRLLATRVLDHLERGAIAASHGAYWTNNAERIDLGLAHGVAGIVAVLARYVAADLERARSRQLVERGVEFLLSTPRPAVGRFTDFVTVDAREVRPSRLGWCYGDAGICLALAAAARVCGRDDWHVETLAIARAMAERPFESTHVVDTPLCHGTSGLAHAFRCLARLYDDPVLAAASERWLAKTLEMRRVGHGLGGFQYAEETADGVTWGDSPTIITGASGAALVLHAADGGDHDWDAKFLFDVDRLPSG